MRHTLAYPVNRIIVYFTRSSRNPVAYVAVAAVALGGKRVARGAELADPLDKARAADQDKLGVDVGLDSGLIGSPV